MKTINTLAAAGVIAALMGSAAQASISPVEANVVPSIVPAASVSVAAKTFDEAVEEYKDRDDDGSIDPRDLHELRLKFAAKTFDEAVEEYKDRDDNGSIDPRDLHELRLKFA